jgi:hypothetical protein
LQQKKVCRAKKNNANNSQESEAAASRKKKKESNKAKETMPIEKPQSERNHSQAKDPNTNLLRAQ